MIERYLVTSKPHLAPWKYGSPKVVEGFDFAEFADAENLMPTIANAQRASGLFGGVTVFNLDDAHDLGRLLYTGMLAREF